MPQPRPFLLSRQSKSVIARRMVLLASAAGLGIAVMISGPGSYRPIHFAAWLSSARAAEVVQHPAGFADLVAKVKPAVISVRVKIDKVASTIGNDDKDDQNSIPFSSGAPLDKFFRQFGFNDVPNHSMQRHQVMTGEGSGFFITADGYAVTNNHVVDDAKSVRVTADDGTIYTARVVGTDPKTDLALIKVDAKNDFPYVKFADQEPRIGDWVVAVGNPFGLGGTVTAGIVSARGRDIGSGPYDDFIQIDAPINKGNSGGPAFDMNGNVIGINTVIYSPSGGSIGIGFDVPADIAKDVIAQLKDRGAVTRGWMGVQIQTVTAAIADSLGMKQTGGAIVDEPRAGSPAAKAGIVAGDVITRLDGKTVKDSHDLARRIAMMAPGTSVTLDVLYQGQTKALTLTLGRMPNQQHAQADRDRPAQSNTVPHLGLTLSPAPDVAGSGDKGVVVMGVDPNGPAADHGFETGDVILDVGGKMVANVADVRHAVAEAQTQGKHDVLMRIKTAEGTRFVALPLAHA
jgi:serine protease Do